MPCNVMRAKATDFVNRCYQEDEQGDELRVAEYLTPVLMEQLK
jgi:hypothetical protein